MKKTLSLLLALLMLSGSLLACSENETADESEKNNSDPVATESEEETVETEPEETVDLSDDLPAKMDFGGRDFIVLGCDERQTRYVYTDDYNGESVNDAVYKRNLTLDERFNAKVKVNQQADYTAARSYVDNCIASSDSEAFHLVGYHVVASSGSAVNGLYLNWYDVPNINFEKPWWAKSTVEDLTLNNKCFLAIGDGMITTVGESTFLFFDKVAANTAGIPDIYQTIRDGKWTLDYVMELSEQVKKDLDGNGVMDENDFYGYCTGINNTPTYNWSLGNKIFTKNAEGKLEYTYYNEHLIDIVDKVYKLYYECGGFKYDSNSKFGVQMLVAEKTLFATGSFTYAVNDLGEIKNEYGIIPNAKFDENQEEYRTIVNGKHEAMAVAKNVNLDDLEFIGTMTEAMCAEAHKQILPVYYDVCLKQRYSTSSEDAEMVDLIVDSRVFDLGYIYDNWAGVSFVIQDLMSAKNKDIASHYASIKEARENYYQKVLTLFED